jgi:tRNA A-37 threonylcarbamoyl transferase component Bud32
LAGKYRVVGRIGAGGMGVVYRAEHVVTGKALALKWLQPQRADEPRATERLIREAQAAARIRHPNVVDVYDVAEQDGAVFLVMELLQGETLRDRLGRGVLDAHACLELLLPAIRAVAVAHREGVVHRDIKPENLFVTRDADDPHRSLLKVLDFGVSKLVDGAPTAGTLTVTGAPLGTPHYMSLEQLQAERDVDARADVYAFGVVLYECLTGQRPFDGESLTAIVVKVATEVPRHPRELRPELGEALCAVVLKAMARRREDRQPTLAALEQELRAAQRSQELRAAQRSDPPRGDDARVRAAARRPLARRGVAIGLLVLVLLLAGAVAAPWWPGPAAEPAATPAPAAVAAPEAVAAPVVDPASAPVPPASTPSTPVAPEAAPSADSLAPAIDPPLPRGPTRRAVFAEGWVYLGEYREGRWVTRYFDGWGEDLPAPGATLTARGRSHVRSTAPNLIGALASVRATLGPEQPVELLERAGWQNTGLIWARVRPRR